MKKVYSLIKASMTGDMNLFKIYTKKNNKLLGILLPLFIAIYLMAMLWGGANEIFEKLAPLHLQYILLPLSVFMVSILTFMEGIYKSGSLLFNCRDDQLLLSLPIKRRVILFVRVFKFYVFELLFNSLFILPIMISYISWAENLNWTYFVVSLVMIIMLPIIPIILSCFIGFITSSIFSRFKHKNAVQIFITIGLLVGVLYLSYNMEGIINYLIQHANDINDLITKVYYPAGVYAKLITDFNFLSLLEFVLTNTVILIVSLLLLSKVYFKINSRIKKVTNTKKIKVENLKIKSNNKVASLIKKELNTFFKTPVFIINAGFALVLFLIATVMISINFDKFSEALMNPNGVNLSPDLILNSKSILIFILISMASYMTSITSSVISLEGKNINILKSLPIETKTILMSKIYSSLVLTTPLLVAGNIVLFIKFRIGLFESLMLLALSILIPLVSHFVGLLVNLKYPKLDAENSTEIVKQSASSFISVMIGMILIIITIIIIYNVLGKYSSTLILLTMTIVYVVIDISLYLYMIRVGVKEFDQLSV